MIVRIMVVDPEPNGARASDVLVYQVPERSREFQLLTQLFDQAGLEWTTLGPSTLAMHLHLRGS